MDVTQTGTLPRKGPVAAYGLTLLFLANMLNYADRSLLGIVVEPIRKELLLNDTQISIVSGFAFSLFYLIAGIAIARWVDRGNRRLILALGVALWSAATAATGLAQGFVSLALCRMLIGVGEATVFPVALSLLADLYPGPRLSRSVSIFQASGGVGIMAGAVLAGLLAASFGWRATFGLFGVVGALVVLLIAFTMRPTPRTAAHGPKELENGGVPPEDGRLLPAVRAILTVPGFAWLAFGYAVSNMMLACLPTWAPAFLLRSHGVELAHIGAVVGPPAVIGGLAGTILSGIFSSRLIARSGNRRAGLIVPIVALPLAVPAFALFLFAPSLPVVMIGIGVMNFMLSSSLGPCVALAVSLVSPNRRGLTSTIMLIVQTIIAFALAPLIVGAASDAFRPSYGEEALRHGLTLMLVTPLLASLLLWIARRRIVAG
ncbi:MFS transporter [Sphingomonas sp. Leaf357]|uniref:spinster family MFS transporter n=1 Tax=Sphingomonas sp. Leaf357 TaxID=1736350 RepID=UPI000700E392|nr:MFS transporter [Sphingomonas sp. Leaf357]KQS03783.1 MFS transporter [Sphingomonas sp. Leaf357]